MTEIQNVKIKMNVTCYECFNAESGFFPCTFSGYFNIDDIEDSHIQKEGDNLEIKNLFQDWLPPISNLNFLPSCPIGKTPIWRHSPGIVPIKEVQWNHDLICPFCREEFRFADRVQNQSSLASHIKKKHLGEWKQFMSHLNVPNIPEDDDFMT